jgi:exosortase/archaeosortase family protein
LKPASGISIKRFILTYIIMMGVFFFIIGFTPLQRVVDINGYYTRGILLVTSKILGFLGITSTYHGSIIKLPMVSLDVRFGCNGLEAVMIYSTAVIAFPSKLKVKLYGIASGFLVIQILNILRISALAYSAVHLKALFYYIHIYVAQGIMIAVSLGIFFIYLSFTGAECTADA